MADTNYLRAEPDTLRTLSCSDFYRDRELILSLAPQMSDEQRSALAKRADECATSKEPALLIQGAADAASGAAAGVAGDIAQQATRIALTVVAAALGAALVYTGVTKLFGVKPITTIAAAVK